MGRLFFFTHSYTLHHATGGTAITNALTPSQTARLLQLSRSRVLQLNNEGRLPATRTPLGRLFDRDVIERFAIERNTRLGA